MKRSQIKRRTPMRRRRKGKPAGILVDEAALERVRKFPCDLCGSTHRPRDAHHIKLRGMGAGQRFDHPYNLLSLCNWVCHVRVDNYTRDFQFKLAAKRENVSWTLAKSVVMEGTRARHLRESDPITTNYEVKGDPCTEQ